MCLQVHAQAHPALCDPRDYSSPGSSVHENFQARILECIAISYSRGSSWPRARNCISPVSWIGRQILYHCATWEANYIFSTRKVMSVLTLSPVCATPSASLIQQVFLNHKIWFWWPYYVRLCCCCSVAKSCPTLCNPMGCSTPDFLVLRYILEFAQTHVHWVGDAIYASHSLSSSPPALHLSQHQGLFQRVGSSLQVAKVLELQLQHQSFQWIFRVDFLYDWLVWSPCWPKDLKESSSALQLESIHSLVLSLLYGPTLISVHDYWKNHSFNYTDLCQQSDVSAF